MGGDMAWILTCTALVLIMIPGLGYLSSPSSGSSGATRSPSQIAEARSSATSSTLASWVSSRLPSAPPTTSSPPSSSPSMSSNSQPSCPPSPSVLHAREAVSSRSFHSSSAGPPSFTTSSHTMSGTPTDGPTILASSTMPAGVLSRSHPVLPASSTRSTSADARVGVPTASSTLRTQSRTSSSALSYSGSDGSASTVAPPSPPTSRRAWPSLPLTSRLASAASPGCFWTGATSTSGRSSASAPGPSLDSSPLHLPPASSVSLPLPSLALPPPASATSSPDSRSGSTLTTPSTSSPVTESLA